MRGHRAIAGAGAAGGLVLAVLAGLLGGAGDAGEAAVPALVLVVLAAGMVDVALRSVLPLGAAARAGTGVAVVALAALLAVGGQEAGRGDPEADIPVNAAVARELPTPPGSRRIAASDLPAFRHDEAAPTGYTRLVRYRAPDDLDGRAFVAYYRRAMRRGWALVEILPAGGGATPVMNYRRGTTTVSLNADNLRRHRFEIAVGRDG